jgi:hypothetical protein
MEAMGDLDVGEMFLNFILELKERIRAGVDLTHFIALHKRQFMVYLQTGPLLNPRQMSYRLGLRQAEAMGPSNEN